MADAGEARDRSRLGRLMRRECPPAARTGAHRTRRLFDTLRRLTAAFRRTPGGCADAAKITESNPDIVMKVAADGRVLYANQSAEKTLYEMGLPIQHAELLLPDGVDQLARSVLGTLGRKVEMLWVAEGRSIRYTVFGLGNEEAVVFQGVDVTDESAAADPR